MESATSKARLAVGFVCVQFIGLAGLGAIAEGLRRIHPPTALVVLGVLIVVWAVLKSRPATEGPRK